MGELLNARVAFSRMIPRLIDKAFEMGFLVTVADVHRDPSCPYGKRGSKHWDGLAVDLNLYTMEGVWLEKTRHHTQLGAWWESIGGVWGGRWQDGNHYQWGE